MIENTLLNYLNGALTAGCYMERPPDLPATAFVVIEKTGSSRTNRITTSTFAIQSYAPTLYGAAELNELVKTAMEEFAWQDAVGAVYLQSDYNYTNPATKQYRYQAVFNVTHY